VEPGENGAPPAGWLKLDDDGNTVEPIPVDLDESRRVVSDIADMGAYERPLLAIVPLIARGFS
jgi:hypothetical protein